MNDSDDPESNVTKYLRNVLNYFALIRKNYYDEHAKLKVLNDNFDRLWEVITKVFHISDPSILQRGRKGDIPIEEFEYLLRKALEKYKIDTALQEDTIILQLEDINKILTGETNYDEDAANNAILKISALHNASQVRLSANKRKLENTEAFIKISTSIRTPVIDNFTIKTE